MFTEQVARHRSLRRWVISAPELQIQDPSESEIDASHEFPGNLSHTLGKIGFVEGHDLSDVGDGVLCEPGAGRWKQDVAGSVEQPGVRRENDAKDCSQSASIESVGLNAWGLYDMLGNVWEWVEDRYGNYPGASTLDPRGRGGGKLRVGRGGSWDAIARACRASARGNGLPGNCRGVFQMQSRLGGELVP